MAVSESINPAVEIFRDLPEYKEMRLSLIRSHVEYLTNQIVRKANLLTKAGKRWTLLMNGLDITTVSHGGMCKEKYRNNFKH